MRERSTRIAAALLAGLLVLALGCQRSAETSSEHRSFEDPEQAVEALVAAIEHDDLDTLRALLGSESEPLISSGDSVADRQERRAFLEKFRAQHELVAGGPNDLVLQVGEDRWPVPVPLVRRDGRWSFDGAAGVHELVARRIGRNELRTIDVMRGFVAAQEEYVAMEHSSIPSGTYAERLRSEPGTRNGLYWETRAGEPQSPAGPFLAAAAAEGYEDGLVSREPYHGYVYRILFEQGPAANGGARNYLVDGKLVDGFALLAVPQAYGTTGITSFTVNQDGIVWQRDLGPKTAELAGSIQAFNPDETWMPLAME